MVRAAVVAIVLSLLGSPAVSIACGLGCVEEARVPVGSGCHEHGAAPALPGLTSTHACHHDAGFEVLFPVQAPAAASAPLRVLEAVAFIVGGTTESAGRLRRFAFPPGVSMTTRVPPPVLRI